MREIDRYPRATLWDRLEELVDAARAHPARTAALAVVVVLVAATMLNAPRPVRLAELVVGDCLYARTSASTSTAPGSRPIGEPTEVEAVITTGAAEYAGCGASHGHEVAALVDLASLEPVAQSARSELRLAVEGRCDAAFEAYVGRPLAGSELETFAVLPSEDQVTSGAAIAACLVARRDGQWLSGPARGRGD